MRLADGWLRRVERHERGGWMGAVLSSDEGGAGRRVMRKGRPKCCPLPGPLPQAGEGAVLRARGSDCDTCRGKLACVWRTTSPAGMCGARDGLLRPAGAAPRCDFPPPEPWRGSGPAGAWRGSRSASTCRRKSACARRTTPRGAGDGRRRTAWSSRVATTDWERHAPMSRAIRCSRSAHPTTARHPFHRHVRTAGIHKR